ncbi:MAG: hypothetical protein FJ197_00920 [Gammaproteobacteria bacterium]|nr:hypothetical protein [Gammaproteobacteria bacterium]
MAADAVEALLEAHQAAEGMRRLLVAPGRGVDRALDEARAAQVLPDLARFLRVVGAVPATLDRAVAVAVVGGRPGAGEAGRGGGVVARQHAVAVLVGEDRGGDPLEVVLHLADPGVGDHFLTLQHPADQQADDDQHDRDFDQRKTFFDYA